MKEWRVIIFAGICVLIIAGGVIFSVRYLSRAEVVVTLTTEPREKEFLVTIKGTSPRHDLADGIIAGAFSSTTRKYSKEYSSSGTKELSVSRAEGNVVIMNAAGELTLAKSTKIVSEGGAIFLLRSRTVVRAGTTKKPSRTVAAVVAERQGTLFNIPPGKFRVPGLAGTGYEKNLSLFSETAMKNGGDDGTVALVTVGDVATGTAQFSAELEKLLTDELRAEFPEYEMPDPFTRIEVSGISTSPAANQVGDRFTVSGEGIIIGIFFMRADLTDAIRAGTLANLPSASTTRNISIRNLTAKNADFSRGEGILGGTAQYEIVADINADMLAERVVGMSSAEAVGLFRSVPGISGAEIRLIPSWIGRIPSNPSHITTIYK